jgi:lysophospholipase L1-like esterase
MRIPIAALLALATAATAQTFREAPEFYSADLSRFSALLNEGHSRTLRIVYLGDSQETTPGGAGAVYVPRLNYELWTIYGNCPETPVSYTGWTTGAQPYCDWLTRNAAATPGGLPGTVPSGSMPPGSNPLLYRSTTVYGHLAMLQHDAAGIDPGALIGGQAAYFNRSGPYALDVFASTLPLSGSVAWQAKPCGTPVANYFVSPLAQGTLAMSLSAPTFSVAVGSTPPLPQTAGYMQVELRGTDPAAPTQILGYRYRSLSHPHGAVVSSFSAGGYRTRDFLQNHGESWDFLRAVGPDMVWLGYGANEAGQGLSAAEFRADQEALVARLKHELPNTPVVLVADPYRTGAGAEFDAYAWAQYQMAQADSGLLTLNSRRVLDAMGWSATGNSLAFLGDGVHYTPHGSRTKAGVEAEMLRQVMAGGCYANCDSSTAVPVLNVGDFTCFLQRFAAGAADANCDGSTVAPVLNIQDFTCFLQRFAGGCP